MFSWISVFQSSVTIGFYMKCNPRLINEEKENLLTGKYRLKMNKKDTRTKPMDVVLKSLSEKRFTLNPLSANPKKSSNTLKQFHW